MEGNSTKMSRRDALKLMGTGALAALVAAADSHGVQAATEAFAPNDVTSRHPAQAAVTLVFWRTAYDKASKLAFPVLDEFYKKQMQAMLPNNISDVIPFVKNLTEWPSDKPEPTLSAWPLAGGTTFDLYTALVDNFGGFWWMDKTSSGFDQPEWEEAWRLTLAMFDAFKLD